MKNRIQRLAERCVNRGSNGGSDRINPMTAQAVPEYAIGRKSFDGFPSRCLGRDSIFQEPSACCVLIKKEIAFAMAAET